MVKLNANQGHHIVALQEARKVMDREIEKAEADLRAARRAARQPVARLVNEALTAGVPARQVAIKGLGYADVGSLKQYVNEKSVDNHIEALAEPEPIGSLPVQVRGDEDFSDMMYVTDSYGNEPFLVVANELDKGTFRVAPYKDEHKDRDELDQAIYRYLITTFGSDITIEWSN